MDYITSNSALMLEKSMNFLWTKQSAISDNITNAETPGYKEKYVTFEEALRDRLDQVHNTSGSVSQIRNILESAEPVVNEAEESTRMDENGVNSTEQALELSRNAYQLQYVMKAMNNDFSMLKTAIGG